MGADIGGEKCGTSGTSWPLTLLCALAGNETAIIGFRVLQGIGGAFVTANSGAIIADLYPPERRGRAYGYNAVGWSLGAVLGIVVGGLIVTNVSRRWIFWINVPIGAGALLLATRVLHEHGERARRRRRSDRRGRSTHRRHRQDASVRGGQQADYFADRCVAPAGRRRCPSTLSSTPDVGLARVADRRRGYPDRPIRVVDAVPKASTGQDLELPMLDFLGGDGHGAELPLEAMLSSVGATRVRSDRHPGAISSLRVLRGEFVPAVAG